MYFDGVFVVAEELDSNHTDSYENERIQEKCEQDSQVLEPAKQMAMSNELKAIFLKESEELEGIVIDAAKDGKISIDDYHQMSLLAMMYIHEEIKPEYGRDQELAFALGMVRACANLIKMGVDSDDINYTVYALKFANLSLGVAKRIDGDKELMRLKAKKAAHTRHSKNHSYKQLVWHYYEQGMNGFNSLDQAAEKISSKSDIPFAFRTVRKWIDEFRNAQKKLLPSA